MHRQVYDLIQAEGRKETLQVLRLTPNDFVEESWVLGFENELEKCLRDWWSVHYSTGGGTEIFRNIET